jgi:hypothetical protein
VASGRCSGAASRRTRSHPERRSSDRGVASRRCSGQAPGALRHVPSAGTFDPPPEREPWMPDRIKSTAVRFGLGCATRVARMRRRDHGEPEPRGDIGGRCPAVVTLTRCYPSFANSFLGWSMRSWDSVTPVAARAQRLPGSHGPDWHGSGQMVSERLTGQHRIGSGSGNETWSLVQRELGAPQRELVAVQLTASTPPPTLRQSPRWMSQRAGTADRGARELMAGR